MGQGEAETTTIDLHIHTLESDGCLSVAEVIREAVARGVGTLALTDHETTNGVERARELGKKHNLRVIPGVELVTAFKGKEVHLLGYFSDEGVIHPDLQRRLRELRRQRTHLAYEMVKRLRRDGFALKWAEVERVANPEGAVSKGHLMRALHEQGNGALSWSVIIKLFEPYGSAYLPFLEHPFEEAVALIYECGGVPVLAHPGLLGDDRMVRELLSYRPMGLEVYYGYWEQREALIQNYKTIAGERAILATGGSDFHGLSGPVKLGEVDVPEQCGRELQSFF